MNIEKMREEFETAVMAYCESIGQVARMDRSPDDRYEYVDTAAAWWAWQASRAAIEIELPKPIPDWGTDGWGDGYKLGIKRCAEAVESLGLKVAQ